MAWKMPDLKFNVTCTLAECKTHATTLKLWATKNVQNLYKGVLRDTFVKQFFFREAMV